MPTIKLIEKKRKERNHYSSKRNNVNHKYVYNTDRWRQTRLNHLGEFPLCENCLRQGIYTLAVQAHHKVEISSTDDIFQKQVLGFDPINLESLCKECHDKLHGTYSKEEMNRIYIKKEKES
jgi:5-methylcytosine-specific restriction protein A